MASPSQQHRKVQPKVARRTKMLGVAESPQKTQLVQSFEGFNASTVSQTHIDNARRCIDLGGTYKERYMYIPFVDIIGRNQGHKDYLNMVASAYDLLLKYVINLLKPKRPQVWRSIKTNNAAFKARVACMDGSIDILRKVGYTEEGVNSLQFPEYIQEPNKPTLFAIAAELLMAKLEVENMQRDDSLVTELLQQYKTRPKESQEQQQLQQQQQQQHMQWQLQPQEDYQSQSAYANNQEVSPQDYYTSPPESVRSPDQYSNYPQGINQGGYQNSYSHQTVVSFEPSLTEHRPHSGEVQQSRPVDNTQSTITPVPKPRTAFHRPTYTYPEFEECYEMPPDSRRPRSQEHVKWESERPSSASSTASGSSESLEQSQQLASSDPSSKKSYRSKLEEFKKRKAATKARHEETSTRSADITPSPYSPASSLPRKAMTQQVSRSPQLPPKTYKKEGSTSSNVFDTSQIKRPPSKPKPAFHADTILEEAETRTAYDLATIDKPRIPIHQPQDPQQGKYCPKCHCKLHSNETVCTYCNLTVGVNEGLQQNGHGLRQQNQPLRASTTTENVYESQVQGDQHLQQMYDEPMLTPPPRPPKQNPREPIRASIPEDVRRPIRQPLDTQATEQHQERLTDFQKLASSNTIPFQPTFQQQQQQLYLSGATGGAYGGGATGVSPIAGVPSDSGIDLLRKKEEAFKQSQRKKGVREEDLERLPELVEAEKCYTKAQKDKAKQKAIREGRYVEEQQDPNKYQRVNLVQEDENDDREQERMTILKMDGLELLGWIKLCTANGYTLQEVEIAFNAVRNQKTGTRKNPMEYLEDNWSHLTQTVQNWVNSTLMNGNPSVGLPSSKQTREALVKAEGDPNTAVNKLYEDRTNKINQLQEKFRKMRELQPHVPELKWEDAVKALSANNMDVDAACYALQCEWLQELYESIFSEHKGVKQTDMEEIKKLIVNEQYNQDTRRRMLMAECSITEMEQADIVFRLIADSGDYPLHYYVDAARDFKDFETAKNFLNKECDICTEIYSIHHMVTMPGCTDSVCRDCFRGHFKVVIKEQGVKHFNCPLCSLPDVTDADQEFYFQIFQSLIKEHLDKECYELCCEKLKDYNLTKEPGFIWCSNDTCRNGWIYDGARGFAHDIQCPVCSKGMCVLCKKPWEAQHEGLTCEAFAQWKADNDPDAQQAGLAAHLESNGIECPQCGMKYDLARGGCMHFKCTRCPNEFCSGCGESFKNGQQCGKLESCAKRGLHGHHPRDCLFYMRDFDVEELQEFLREKNVKFDTEPPKEQVEAARRMKREMEAGAQKQPEDQAADVEPAAEPQDQQQAAAAADVQAPAGEEEEEEEEVELHCRVEEQKEDVDGLKDEACGRKVEKGHAGLCLIHYKEYLVNKINKEKLDPVELYTTIKITAMLTREELAVPDKNDFDDDDQYREGLIEEVKDKLPLTFEKNKQNRAAQQVQE